MDMHTPLLKKLDKGCSNAKVVHGTWVPIDEPPLNGTE